MPRFVHHWVVLASLAVVGVPQAPAPAPPQAFRAGVELVRMPVIVSDKTGQVRRGLQLDDFEVREDGTLQTLTFFSEGPPGAAVPMHLGLLVDKSESMERDLRSATDAAVRFVNALDETDDVTFVDFDTTVRVGRFSPPSYPLMFERMRAPKASGGTSLYDAVGLYVNASLDREGQHILLLYTDGGDSTSTTSYSKLQDLLRLGDVMIYSIGYVENQLSSVRFAQQSKIGQIAHETGGEAFFPTSTKEIDEAYAKILAELAGRYTLGYVSTNPVRDSKFRKVAVTLKSGRADLKGLKVRTRSGYLAIPPMRGQ